MPLDQAIAIVKAAGYRVSKPSPRRVKPRLNAIGRPYSPQYDPNYRMSYKGASIARLSKPYGDSMRFVQ